VWRFISRAAAIGTDYLVPTVVEAAEDVGRLLVGEAEHLDQQERLAMLVRDGAEGRGVLFSGDILQVVSDRNWVSFMWSYPNLIPLPAAEIERIRAVVESLDFDRIYGAWWDRVIETDAKAKVLRSADRYVDAITRGR